MRKSAQKSCGRKQGLTSVSGVAYIPLSASELARVVEVKLGAKEDSVKTLSISLCPTGQFFNITANINSLLPCLS